MGLKIKNIGNYKKSIIKVKIKDMFNLPHTNQFEGVDIYTHPKFKKTTESIVKNGYTPGDEFGYPEGVYVEHLKKYKVAEGNHRFKILKELYGPEYEMEVVEMESMSQVLLEGLYKVLRSYTDGKKPYIILKDILKFLVSIPVELAQRLYKTPILVVLFLTYIIFWEFHNLLLILLIILLIGIIPKENFITRKITSYLKPDNKLHVVIFNILKNTRIIVFGVLTLWLMYSFIVNNIIAFGVLIVASYLIQKILVYILDDIPDNAGKWSTLEELVRGIKRKLTNKK